MAKPISLKESYDGQSMWVQGESPKGRLKLVSGSPVSTAASTSVTEVFGSLVTTVVSTSAMKGSNFGFSGVEVTNWRLKEETQTPIAGVLRVGTTAKLMGPGYVVSSDLRHQGVTQNSFSPLSGLGSEEGLYFGEKNDSTMVSSEKEEKWSNPIAKPVSPSYLDGVEML